MRKFIKSISATNLKGQTFSHDLNKVTVIIGANEVGKTARLDCILLAQLGYKLKPGKKPMKTADAIFRSCGQRGGGATELITANTMSDGQKIERSWRMKRGKISYDGPDDSFIPPMMLDPSGFFAISGPERRNMVLQQVDLEALGIGMLPLKSKLEPEFMALIQTLPAKAAYLEVEDKIHECEADRQATNGSVYDWLTKVVDAITALRDKESSLADTHEQTLRGLTDNKATDNDMTALQSVQPEINAARERHTAAVAAEATALAAFTAAQRKVEETKQVTARVVDETVVRQQVAAKEAEIAEHQKVKMPTSQFKAKAMERPRPTDTAERHARSEAENKATIANSRLRDATAEMKRIEAQIEEAKHKTTCPACGQNIAHLQAEVIKKLQEQLSAAQGKHVSATSVAAIVNGNLSDAQTILELAEQDTQIWDAAKRNLDEENQKAVRAHNAKVTAYNGAQAVINAARAAIAKLLISIEANQTARDAQALLPTLQTALNEASADYVVARDAVPPIVEQIRQLETKQRQFIARTQNERLANQSREQLKTANERLAVFKAALKVVSDEQKRAGEEAFNALLKHARKMTDGNLRAPLEFRDGELGITYDGNFVEIGEFSGMQQIFAFSGLGLALTQNSQSVRIVMIDELGRLTCENKHKLIDRLLELIKQGVLDQAVLCDVSGDDYLNYDLNPDVELITIDNAGEQF